VQVNYKHHGASQCLGAADCTIKLTHTSCTLSRNFTTNFTLLFVLQV
jgi:hypothetical protein